RDVVMIGISDAEYQSQDWFNGRSPLDCKKVLEIVRAIAAGRPRVIGVDLDTSSGDFTCLNDVPAAAPPIVWARDAVGDSPKSLFQPLPVLNGATLRPRDRAGIVQFPVDADGVIRRYARRLQTSEGEVDSFPWMVAKTVNAGSGGEMLRLNFAGERFSFHPL